jgi:hypothetical protein
MVKIQRNARMCFGLAKCDICSYLLALEQYVCTCTKGTYGPMTLAKCLADGKSAFQRDCTFAPISTSSQGLAVSDISFRSPSLFYLLTAGVEVVFILTRSHSDTHHSR